MARWDEIFSLPVHNPPTLEFSSSDIVWSTVEGWRDNKDRVALIPFARVEDFVRGESSNKECPTRFHVEARRRRPPKAPYKPKVDGVLEYILYWCSFGPDDHRKGGVVRPSRNTYVPKKKNSGRPNTKRGCICHFIVKRLIAEPSVALIIYNEDRHVDKRGVPCHGPQDAKAAGTSAMFAPYISEDLRLRVLSLLHVGVSVETIMQRHNESVEKQGGPSNRDDLLTHRYVRRQERVIRRSTYELDADDAVSIGMWVENHQSHVFFFEDFSDVDPFTLGIQTEWQLQQMIRFGNRGLLASDSRFGTNKLKYPVHSLLVFNENNKAIPVAWIVAPKFESSDAHKWMRALFNRVQAKDPAWKLAGFIVDDPLADVLTIRDVFQCSVLMSFWRVRHAWQKNLVKKCVDNEMRATISRRFHQAMDNICHKQGTEGLFEDLIADFLDESEFMDYFKATWYPRIGMWISALQNLPLASQETCAAMEFYHNQLKLRLLNERKPCMYKRVDWLVDKLGSKVHSYFWLDEYSEKDDYARYWKDEWVSGLTSWRKALKIPDSNVVMEGTCAKVIDNLEQDRAYIVWNPGSQFGICNCSWAEMGNLCEHILKVINAYRKRSSIPSINLLQYHQALIDMLHCPPHDSLIRDHAVSLAAFVQKQLHRLVNLESNNTTMDVASFASRYGQSVTERPINEEALLSHDENNSGDGNIATEETKGRTDICNPSCGEEISSDDMDVDPSSICISPPGLYSVDEVVARSVFSGSRQKSLFDTGAEVLSPTGDALNNPTGFEDQILDRNSHDMDEDIDIPPSAKEFVEQCTVAQPYDHHSNDIEPTVTCETSNDNIVRKIAPSASMPVESQAVEVEGSSGDLIENKMQEIETENGMECVEQCSVTHPDDLDIHGIEPAVIFRTSVDNTVNETSPSASEPVKFQVVKVAETSGVIPERDGMDSKNGNASNYPSSADNDFTVNGVHKDIINGSK